MMPDEEIIKLFREMKALLDDYERSLMFAEAVWIELKPIPIEFFPYMEAQCKFNEDKLRTEARYNAQCLYFCVVKCIMEDEQNTEGSISINYETRQNIVERKQRSLDKLILLFPPDKHEFIYQMFAEDDAEDLPHEEFMFKCHNVAKAVILGFFPEIAELNGNSIRKIDNMSYIEMSDWVQSFYEHSEFDTITRSSAEDVHGCVRLVFEPVSCVVNGAVCLISGAQVLLTRCAAAIAGLLAAMHEAKRARDMRKYPFWARGSAYIGTSSTMRPERYGAIARRLAARPKETGEASGAAIDARCAAVQKHIPLFQVNMR